MQGLWTANFKTPLGMGYGVAYFTAKEIFGGDSTFTYVGKYTESGSLVEAQLQVRPFNSSTISVFGDGGAFELTINGRIEGNVLTGFGSASHYPGISFAVTLSRAAA